MEDRYRKLALEDSLKRTCHYPSACRELAIILKLSFSKFPKILQSLIFQDVLTAFRLLPRMQTQTSVSAANTLIQSVESALPKQKKALAVSEFKQAMVAHKRFSKSRHTEQDSVELPQDVLVHVFSFLDLQSLVSVSQVSRSWNDASKDNHIWRSMYTVYFNTLYNVSCPIDGMLLGFTLNDMFEFSQKSIVCNNRNWISVFKKAYDEFASKKLFTSSRGFCKHCCTIFWVSDMGKEKSKLKCRYHQIKAMSSRQIVEYIDGDYASSESDTDSDTDSDSYTDSVSKLWAYPKRIRSIK